MTCLVLSYSSSRFLCWTADSRPSGFFCSTSFCNNCSACLEPDANSCCSSREQTCANENVGSEATSANIWDWLTLTYSLKPTAPRMSLMSPFTVQSMKSTHVTIFRYNISATEHETTWLRVRCFVEEETSLKVSLQSLLPQNITILSLLVLILKAATTTLVEWSALLLCARCDKRPLTTALTTLKK
jgi:hypothetical protein